MLIRTFLVKSLKKEKTIQGLNFILGNVGMVLWIFLSRNSMLINKLEASHLRKQQQFRYQYVRGRVLAKLSLLFF